MNVQQTFKGFMRLLELWCTICMRQDLIALIYTFRMYYCVLSTVYIRLIKANWHKNTVKSHFIFVVVPYLNPNICMFKC